jgi:hypothetical protein
VIDVEIDMSSKIETELGGSDKSRLGIEGDQRYGAMHMFGDGEVEVEVKQKPEKRMGSERD